MTHVETVFPVGDHPTDKQFSEIMEVAALAKLYSPDLDVEAYVERELNKLGYSLETVPEGATIH